MNYMPGTASKPSFLGTGALLLGLAAASCGGGGGGGGGGTITTAPPDSGEMPNTVGLVAAAAGGSSAQVRWVATDADGNPVPIAVFRSTAAGSVYQGAPILVGPPGDSALVSGLAGGTEFFFGLAINAGGGNYEPVGEILTVKTGAPIFVDASSTAVTPDGLTPATAFTDPISGVLTAFGNGGGNVWIAAGDYQNVSIPLWPGVHVYGGFGPLFGLASRDPATKPTVLHGQAGNEICEIINGSPGGVLDGMRLDGGGVATFGVDIDDSPAQLRSLEIVDCKSDGIRIRSASTTSAPDVCVTRCLSSGNRGDGLSLDGAFELSIEGSRFSSNRTEGVELGGLRGPEGVPVELAVRDSIFSGNGNEGLDCDLVPPLATGPGGGFYSVSIENSVFELNGYGGLSGSMSGLNIDIDFELIPGWEADIEVRGCVARGNVRHGVRLDLDSTASTIVHRLLSTGNGGDGISVSSESTPGIATISASALVGNRGVGIRASLGNVPVLVSHSILAGNEQGGVLSTFAESTVVSSVAWLQPTFLTGARDHFNTAVTDPLLSTFVNVPVEYAGVVGFDGQTLTLDDASGLVLGDPVEVADDGTLRTIAGFGGANQVSLSPNPAYLPVPTLLARFPQAAPVLEDYRLSATSPAVGSGMANPSTGPANCGVFGSPSGGIVGREEPDPDKLFFAEGTSPSTETVLGSNEDFRVSFEGGVIDSLSVGSLTVRALNSAGMMMGGATFFVQNGRLVASPPGGGWPQGDVTLELLEGLAATDGTPLATPIALPLRAQ